MDSKDSASLSGGLPHAGQLLARWRTEVAGDSMRRCANRLDDMAVSLWSMWESGRENIPPHRFGEIDESLRAHGVLADLLRASTTGAAFAPRATWSFNRQGRSRPWWVLIRAADPTADTTVWADWGPVYAKDIRVGPSGTVINVPVSVPNPAANFHFRNGVGWVDMGTGRIPRDLGFDAVRGVDLIEAPFLDYATQVFMRRIRSWGRGRPGWEQHVMSFFGGATFVRDALAVPTDAADKDPAINVDLRGRRGPAVQRPEGADFERARSGRLRSRPDVASVTTSIDPTHPASEDQIRRLEAGGSPRVRLLRARLDVICQADGHLTDDPVDVVLVHTDGGGTATHEVRFPDWWVGPVWFRATTPGGLPLKLRVQWGDWVKEPTLDSGQTAAARRPAHDYPAPLLTAPFKAVVTAGLGRVDGAVDINRHWDMVDSRAERRLVRQFRRTYLATFTRTPGEAARSIRHFHRQGRPFDRATPAPPPGPPQ